MNVKNLAIGFHIPKTMCTIVCEKLGTKVCLASIEQSCCYYKFSPFFPFTFPYFLLFNIDFDLTHIMVMRSGV